MKSITRLFDLLELYKDEYKSKPDAFVCKERGVWKKYSSSDYLSYSRLISMGLLSMGIKRGDRIGTIMVNCPEWNFFDIGILQIGAVQVPIYPTISEESYRYILNDAQVEMIIISNTDIYRRIRNVCGDISSLKTIISIDHIRGVKHWTEIVELGKKYQHPEKLELIREDIDTDNLATIIYTSGTTGQPKGVMLSHNNFITNFKECAKIPDFTPNDRALSFLPLCHVYERMLNYLYQYCGMSVFYAESLDKLGDNMREIRPTTFAAVPRILEKIYDKIVSRSRTRTGPEKVIFFWALRQGHKYELNHTKGFYYELKLWIANRLVFRKWRRALGNRIKLIVCGGASLHPRLTRLFWAAGIPVMEGYGLTETSPVIATNNFEKGGVRFGTVGPVLPGIEVQIAADGEILCKGPNVMLGYYNRPEQTSEAIDPEGWFHTGDIGVLEDGKYLKITDRKKEIFKTSTGRYVAPQVIEQKFQESPFIEHIMIIGENRKYTAALIVPDFEYLKNWCAIKQVPYITRDKAVHNQRIIRRIKEEVKRFNIDLGQTEKIKKFRLVADEWKMETGELTPTLKLRRKFLLEKYYQVIEQTYRSSEFNYKVEID
ncbi:MAG: long-chain fatty acid--CoA ligase [Bacteroidetes bacterium]|nr:long-chain fatty acid--CoA ligase [Bacteroidota bacterium]